MQIIQRRKIFYIISLLIIIPGIISLFYQGLNLGIDFKGGSVLQIKLDSSVPSSEVRSVLAGFGLEKAEVQKSDGIFYIRTQELSQEKTNEIMAAMKKEFSEVTFMNSEFVGGTIGNELTRNALIAIAISALAMLIYISFRFEWTFAVAAVLAIIHNVLVVLGAFSIMQWEVNTAFIAAILTIVGYTINDTIIIFDRVRENLRVVKRPDYMELLNKSILQTMNRSLNTVLTSIFTLIALLIFGGATIKLFVTAMLIGFIVGAYTSIFIASPLWYEIKKTA
jgi:preprotein translocase subunit SecF